MYVFFPPQVDHMNNKVEKFLDNQEKLAAKQSQESEQFIKDLVVKNEKLSEQMKAEQEAAAEFRKVRLT